MKRISIGFSIAIMLLGTLIYLDNIVWAQEFDTPILTLGVQGGGSPVCTDPGDTRSYVTLMNGNPSCSDINSENSCIKSFKVDHCVVVSGIEDCEEEGKTLADLNTDGKIYTFSLDGTEDHTVTITIIYTDLGFTFDWESTLSIDQVIVKGANCANVYLYEPESTGDEGLHAPINPGNNTYYSNISHIEFCFDYELEVTKTAVTSFTRTYLWDVEKVLDTNNPDFPIELPIVITTGETLTIPYKITVENTGSLDSDWAVEGEITVINPSPYNDAIISGINDVIQSDNISVMPDCATEFPYTLPKAVKNVDGTWSFSTLSCTYSTPLDDASARTNIATVEVDETSCVGGNSAEAAVSFGEPTTLVDDCVDVFDQFTKGGIQGTAEQIGTVCLVDSPFEIIDLYELVFGSDICIGGTGDIEVELENVASLYGDNGLIDESNLETPNIVIIYVTVACEGGCTLTPGYWKTHSEFGSAPYDDNWAYLPNGASTPFFLSGQTYYHVLWTAPAGNAYYILAHAYIAAQLNILNGADPTAVNSAMSSATAFFNAYTPSSTLSKSLRATVIANAVILDNYNNGLIGPGHCSENTTP